MNRCLKDKTLLVLHDGGGTREQRTHLTECEACAGRYRDFSRDLDAISQILRAEPPPTTASDRFHPLSRRWSFAAFAVALALVLLWGGVRTWNSAVRSPLKGADNESWSLLDEMPADLFSLNEALAVELLTEVGDYELASMALESDRPCEWYDLPISSEAEPPIEELERSAGTLFRSCVEVEVNSAHNNR
jgi:hypothetical protein